MKQGPNIAHSVRDRLVNLSRIRREDYNHILIRYGLERFLVRLAASKHRDVFVLKGAMLFAVWTKQPFRATKDMDLLGFGDPSAEALAATFRDICATEAEPDGLTFVPDSVTVSPIREGQAYMGQRVGILAMLAKARILLQVDVGFGDAVVPAEERTEYPTLLGTPPPLIRVYSKETAIAEKLHAIVTHGMANSRMKDYYDLQMITHEFGFGGQRVADAIEATFGRRGTQLPPDTPVGLSSVFSEDRMAKMRWQAFCVRNKLRDMSLPEVVTWLWGFFGEPLACIIEARPCQKAWAPEGKWV